MRKKGLLSLFVLMFSLCSIFGLINLGAKNETVQASVLSDNVWDGTYPTDHPGNADYYDTGSDVFIYTAKGLAYFASKVNANAADSYNGKTIKLESNIDLNGNTWIPIGNQSRKYFQGTFDGQGHFIYGMNITGDYYNVGFFGSVGNGGIIKNLHIRNASINTGSGSTVANVGGVAGQIINYSANVQSVPVVIENCSFSGSITTNAKYLGGIVGVIGTGTGSGFNNVCSKIKNVQSSAELNAQVSGSSVGGVVGYYAGRGIENAGFDGSITSQQGGQLGGIIGFAASNSYALTLNNIYSIGKINAGSGDSCNVGGLIGRAATNASGNKVSYSYNAGALIGGGYVAGLVGFVGSADEWEIENSYNVGSVGTGSVQAITAANGAQAKAELCVYQGAANKLKLKNVYFEGVKNSLVVNGDNKYGALKDFKAWSKTKGLYSNAREDAEAAKSYDVWSNKWDFDGTWAISTMTNGGYPYAKEVASMYGRDTYYGTTANSGLKGDGTELSPYLIYTAGDLSYVAEQVNSGIGNDKYYSLQNDIDLSSRTWVPIGRNGNTFTGVFDGNGHTIYGLSSSMQSTLYQSYGVFGMTSGNSVIKNLNVAEVRYLSSDNAGALIGNVSGSTYLVNCTTTWNNPIGTGAGNLYVYFGEENLKSSASGLNGWTKTTAKGYDVEIDFNGGKAFDKNGNMIFGEYHVLVDQSGALVSDQVRTYQTQLLPLRSNHLHGFTKEGNNEATVTVREGYQLAGFARGSSVWDFNEKTSTVGDCSDGNLTVVAQYTEPTQTLTLHYNAYEKDNFSATEKVETKTVGYDSVLYEVWPEIFEKTRTDFVCEGVYQTYSSNEFGGKLTIEDAHMLVNANKDFYLKWVGSSSETHTFKVRVSYPGYFDANIEGHGDYAAQTHFAFEDAIKAVQLNSTVDGTVSSTSKIEVDENGKYVDYIFTFNTLASDMVTNYLSLDFEIAEGYRVYNESLTYIHLGMEYGTPSDTDYGDYGRLTTTGSLNLVKEEDSITGTEKNNPFREIKWLNMQDDYTIEIALEREKYSFQLGLSHENEDDDFYFAFGPGVLAKSGINLNGTEPSASDVYVANDPINGVTLLSDNRMTSYYGTMISYADGEYFPFTFIDEEGVSRSYRLYKDIADDVTKYTLIEGVFANGVFIKDDVIVRLNETISEGKTNRTIEYYYGANFVFVAMTKNSGVKFKERTAVVNENYESSFVKDVDDPTKDNESKVLAKFSNFGPISQQIIFATELTTISTEYRFQINEEIVELNSAKSPVFSTDTYTYEKVPTGSPEQNITFTVEPSRYYKFPGKNTDADLWSYIAIEKYDYDDEEWDPITIYTGWGSSVDENTHVITLSYTSDITAGKYRFTIKLVPIYYSLSVKSNYDIAEIEVSASKYDNIAYNEKVTISTEVENRAYFFNGWEVIVDEARGEYRTIETVNGDALRYEYTNGNFVYGDLFEYCMTNGLIDEGATTISVRAKYEKKSISLSMYQGRFYDYDDSTERELAGSGLSATLNGGATNVTYQTMDDARGPLLGNFKNVSFTKDGMNAGGYFIVGYRIYYGNGYEYLDGHMLTPVSYYNQFNLHDYLLSRVTMLDLQTMSPLSQDTEFAGQKSLNYYLMPVLKRRGITLAFHSGTEDVDSLYTDGKKGTVYNENGEETTDLVLSYSSVFGKSFDIEGAVDYGSVAEPVNLNRIYSSRKGYHKPTTNYLAYRVGETIFANYINFDNSMLTNAAPESTPENAVLHFFYVWEPNEYSISFDTNGGTLSSEYSALIPVIYEETVTGVANKNQITKTGYTFGGWTWNGNLVVNADGECLECELFDSHGKYVYTDSVSLVASWTANPYQIKIMTNGANSIYKNGSLVEIEENQPEHFETYTITYDDTFEAILSDFGAEKTLRKDFEFAGLYFDDTSMLDSNKVSASTVYNVQLSQVDLTANPTLTLYVGWNFVGDYQIDFEEYTDDIIYTATEHTISLGEYWKQGEEFNSGFVVSYVGGTFQIGLPEETHATVEVLLNEQQATSFVVKNAGFYGKYFSINVIDNSTYLNLGVVDSRSVYVTFDVLKAEIDVENSIQHDTRKLINLKKIVKPLMSSSSYSAINSISTLAGFANYIKGTDSTASAATNDQIYEFVMTKSYLVLTMNDYLLYRDWTYENFAAYKEENAEEVEEIVNSLEFFEFFDYQDASSTKDAGDYKNVVVLKSVDGRVSDSTIRSELDINEVKGVDVSGETIDARRSVDLRVYVAGLDEILNNYDLNVDGESKYFTIGRLYILPQILNVANSERSLYSYYDESVEEVSIDWAAGRDSIEYEERSFYKIMDNIYLNASLVTSNIGSGENDTEYSIFDKENTLYFKNVMILEKVGDDEYQNISNRFKIMPFENEVYTILNIKNVAEVTFSGKFLTIEDGIRKLFDVGSKFNVHNLLKITQVKYYNGSDQSAQDDENQWTSIRDENFLAEKAYTTAESGGMLLFEVRKNNDNTVSLFINPVVKKIYVSVSTNQLAQYAKLFKWSDSEILNVDGSMEPNGGFELLTNNIEYFDSGITKLEYYAIYTDLVYVSYNLNFPEGYTAQSLTKSELQLGVSTIDDLYVPNEPGFEVDTMKAQDVSGAEKELSTLFAGENDTFSGLMYSDAYAPVTINVKWKVGEIDYTQIMHDLTAQVGTINQINYESVVRIDNKNDTLFNYTYVWMKGSDIVSTTNELSFENGGLVPDSGAYKLIVSANVAEKYRSVVNDEGSSYSVELEFGVNFVAHKLVEVSLGGNGQTTYDATNHINEWYLNIKYHYYDNEIEEYISEPIDGSLYYTADGVLKTIVTFGGIETNEIKNVGSYHIKFVYSTDYFTVDSGVTIQTEFDFLVVPFEVDIEDLLTTFGKKFNAPDVTLMQQLVTGVENIDIELQRDAGEDVGLYNLYVSDILIEHKENYILTYRDSVVFANSVADSTVAVGKFEISKASALVLSYEVSYAQPKNLVMEYTTDGYSVNLTNALALEIRSNGVLKKSISLKLYDEENDTEITNASVLSIIKSKVSDITSYLFGTARIETAIASTSYSYDFELGTEISKYFTTIYFESGYQFTIDRQQIDVSSLVLNKVYDGSVNAYFDLSLNRLNSVEEYEDVYIHAVYSSAHVGTNIRVDLSVVGNETEDISNFVLSSKTAYAEITKLTATATFETTANSYTYGTITTANFANYIKAPVIMAGSENVSALLIEGYYSYSFTLPATALSNSNQYVYAGNYTISVVSSFADFNMSVVAPTLTINALSITHTLTQAMYREIATNAVVGPYTETISISESGDEILLNYYAHGISSAGEFVAGTFYDLELQNDLYCNNSIRITVPLGNDALEILSETDIVYLRFDTASVLTQQYNGQEYTISISIAEMKMYIENGDTSVSTDISFWKEGAQQTISDMTQLEIFSSVNIDGETVSVTEFENAAAYRLSLKTRSLTYPNIMFENPYSFTIQKRSIYVSRLTISKQYDGSSSYNITSFDGKIAEQDVEVVVTFQDAGVGVNKQAQLSLIGADSLNYALSTTTATGDITKRNATVVLTKNVYTYGEIAEGDNLQFEVVSNEKVVAINEYDVSFAIQGADYTEGRRYLTVGQYALTMTGSSTSYNLSFDSAIKLQVTRFALDVIFEQSGEISVEYGEESTQTNTFDYAYWSPLYEFVSLVVTREGGTNIGYYRALSATTTNPNYLINSVNNEIGDGIYNITKSSKTIYLLLADEEEVTSSAAETITFEFDGKEYNNIVVDTTSSVYQLQLTNGTETRGFNLNTYMFDGTKYTKVTTSLQNLKVTLNLLNPVRNVNTYRYAMREASASNYEVSLMKSGQLYNDIIVVQKELYFKESVLTSVFNNKDAEFEFDDATEFVDGIVSENIGINITFKKAAENARYVGENYGIEAELSGETSEIANYHLNLTTEDSTQVTGKILKAEMNVEIGSQVLTYGEDVDVDHIYTATTDVDLTGYDESRLNISCAIVGAQNSTAGKLKAGVYEISCSYTSMDFEILFSVNGISVDEYQNQANITIRQKQLTYSDTLADMRGAFTKDYDGTTSSDIAESGRIVFNGVLEGDQISLVAAEYATPDLGESIPVTLYLGGADYENYKIDQWPYGRIVPVMYTLEFDYNANGSTSVRSNIENVGGKTLTHLAFQFVSISTLTANSYDDDTNGPENFPTSLSGYTGFSFRRWTLNFNNVEDGGALHTYLQSLATRFNLTAEYENNVFKFVVGNNPATVELLNYILKDYDNDNLTNMYYGFRSAEERKITFVADWGVRQFEMSFRVADQNGKTSDYGTIVVNSETTIERTGTVSIDYNHPVSIVLTPSAHCSYMGTYDEREGFRYDDRVSDLNISLDGNGGATIYIAKLSTDYGLVIRFKAQQVDVDIDITDAESTEVGNENFERGSGKFTWSTNYFSLKDVTLADLDIWRVGYELESITIGSDTFVESEYDVVKLQDYVLTESDTTLTITPNFVSVGVVVTLDYNYDNRKQNIAVAFDSRYDSSADWEETPVREGYNFLGWFNANGDVVTGETEISTTSPHTLTAHWEIASFDISLSIEHGKIQIDSQTVSSYTNTLIYGQTLYFTATADEGYYFESDWGEDFSLSISGAQANVSVTMPGHEINYTITPVARENRVSYTGAFIEKIEVFDITDGQSEIVVGDGEFSVETGKKIRIVVTPENGHLMESFEVNDENLQISDIIENGVLTLEVEGIVKDVAFTFLTKESRHNVSITFDDVEKIDTLIVNGLTYFDLDDLEFSVMLGEALELQIKYAHGYLLGDYVCGQDYDIAVNTTEIYDETYYLVSISNVEEDGSVSFETDLQTYTLTLQVVSYNEDREIVVEPANKAFVSGSYTTSVTLPYGEEAQIIANTTNTNYSFAGWSKDGVNVFSTSRTHTYTITETETVYAIFSAIRFNISFGTYEYYKLYTEYGDPDREETHYKELFGIGEGYFADPEMTEHIDEFSIYYGASKDVYYKTPDGYRFYGYGMNTETGFKFLAWDDGYSANCFNISTLDLDEEERDVEIYVVIRALSSQISFSTEIDIDGAKEEDVDVGRIELVSSTGDKVNEFGYVDGERTHYNSDDFVDGQAVSTKHFRAIDYTGGKMYIKVSVEKEGYRLYQIRANDETLIVELVSELDGYNIYGISGFVGGTNFDVKVLFKPNLNKIKINFAKDMELVDGGAFDYATEDVNKVFSSGRGFNEIEISAYTDSSFRIYAYVDMGYTIDPNNIQIVDENNLIVPGSITYQALNALTSGYSCMITFDVTGYLGDNSIKIMLTPKTYTIHLMEGTEKLVTIKNVEYNTFINLSQANSANITILDSRINYANGMLNVKLAKQNHNFEGFFSYENGAGVRYINSDGQASLLMHETGYYYDLGTSSYKIAGNTKINETTGEIEISLYLYWSYLKTRITFTIIPATASVVTAQDMVSGVDYSNSWFYPASPNYIEVAYNTSIKIVAPEIDGYKFYKFIISQRNKNGEWLTDVTTYSNAIPWETNEIDAIVECNIQVIYYVKIDVVVYGGLGTYSISQQTEDAQAQKLVAESYIDSTNPFTLAALPDDGYTFTRWNNITSGRQSMQQEWSGLIVTTKSTFVMNLQGDYVKLRFTQLNARGIEELYDHTHGQLLQASALSINNSTRNFVIATFIRNEFVSKLSEIEVKVGDVVTFSLAVDYGYGVEWNIEGFKYQGYKDERYMFSLSITADMATNEFVRVIPTFRNQISAIYIRREFVADQTGHGAIDYDNVDVAGYVVRGSNKVEQVTIERGNDIRLTIRVNDRYAIALAKISAADHQFDVTKFFSDGVLNISKEYVEENKLLGTLELLLQFRRNMWEDKDLSNEFAGEGTTRNPYEINSVDDLVLMMQRVNSGEKDEYGDYYYNASYILKTDITLGDGFWTPIGTERFAFNGSFDFNRHDVTSIYNLYIYDNTSYNGLFGVLGASAKISGGKATVWYWYLIGAVGLGLVAMVIIIVAVSKRRKERQEVMSRK